MRSFRMAFYVVAAVGLPAASQAATIQQLQGSVMANTGGGYKSVTSPGSIPVGTRIMAAAGGSATIVYDNGCEERVEPGMVVVVKETIECKAAAAPFGAAPYVVGGIAVAGGAALAVGLSNKKKNPASP
ncbi:MAG: hypothetical protein AB7F78_19465 [Hyphomicrobiaceae bacterium]